MNTYKLSIPLHMNMDYINLIMAKWDQTDYLLFDGETLNVTIADEDDGRALCEQLDQLWCSKSPDGSVGFVDFIQTFGEVEPNPFGRGDKGEPSCLYANSLTARDLIIRAISCGLTKTELLAEIQALYGDADEIVFGRGDDGKSTLYYLLNDKQKELYVRIAMELDELDADFSLDQIKEVYNALIQDPEAIDIS